MDASSWTERLADFRRATPELLERRDLDRRTDSKFLLPPDAALDFLTALERDYAVLAAGNALLAEYRTLYFDTPALDLFHDHRRGRRVRHKVRIRHYPDRCTTRLEVKTRRTELETVKVWRTRRYGDDHLTRDDQAFVAQHTGFLAPVTPQAWTRFHRVTLLGLETRERVTLDSGLRLGRGERVRRLDAVVIVEVKQWPFQRCTPVMVALRTAGHRPAWASKYCSAIALAQPGVNANELRPGLRALIQGAA